MDPSSDSVVATARSTACRSVTSPAIVIALPPFRITASAVALISTCVRGSGDLEATLGKRQRERTAKATSSAGDQRDTRFA